MTRVIRFGADCLAGIPSIIFGLFGFIFFVTKLRFGWSILSGGLTLAFMILPTIIRTSEEAIKACRRSTARSASPWAHEWQTVTRVVLPSALPGIVTGIILSVGRSIGETAAVIFTAGSACACRPRSSRLPDDGRPLLHPGPGRHLDDNAYGTAAVLIISILAINIVSYWMMNRFIRSTREDG